MCYKSCGNDCCSAEQIRKGDVCVTFDNQIYVVTPDGEKVVVDNCDGGLILPNNEEKLDCFHLDK